MNNLALVLDNLGHNEDARCVYERALAIDEKHFGKDHVQVAITMNNLAIVFKYLGHYEDARCLYERALAINEKHFGKDHV